MNENIIVKGLVVTKKLICY